MGVLLRSRGPNTACDCRVRDSSDRTQAGTTLERMDLRNEMLAGQVQAACVGGHATTIINVSRELRQTAELLAKITGGLDDRLQAAVTSWPGLSG